MQILLVESKTIQTETAFKQAHSNVSFPSELTDQDLSDFGAALFYPSSPPSVPAEKKAVVDGVEQVDGKWQHKWTIVDMTAEDTAALANTVRKDRNLLLQECDWTQVGDSSVADAWKDYRQELRNVPASDGFPHTVNWPTKPN